VPTVPTGRLRRTAALASAFLVAAGSAWAVTMNADAAEGEWYDPSALTASCLAEIPELGSADSCRFEPWERKLFTGEQVRVSTDTNNCTAQATTKDITWSQSSTETNSIDVGAEIGADLASVFSASISTTFGVSWSYSVTNGETEHAPIPAYSRGWVERAAAMQSVTGRMVINYPGRRHGHFEWYTYPTVTNQVASNDPAGLAHADVVLRSQALTEQELVDMCKLPPQQARAIAADPVPATTQNLQKAKAPTSDVQTSGDTAQQSAT
jgi:hypothetical protein